MKVHILQHNNSILNHFLAQLRDVDVQADRMRFRQNLHRIGQVMALEISKNLHYKPATITTPLAEKQTKLFTNDVVVCSILRAGLALHEGLLSYFDAADNGFISAYRHHPNYDDYFEIKTEYKAVPPIDGRTLILADPMLATGLSLEAVYQKLTETETPAEVHIAVVIAAPEGVDFLKQHLPDTVNLWIADLDSHLNDKKYIIPGLGDAGDLAYGPKL